MGTFQSSQQQNITRLSYIDITMAADDPVAQEIRVSTTTIVLTHVSQNTFASAPKTRYFLQIIGYLYHVAIVWL